MTEPHTPSDRDQKIIAFNKTWRSVYWGVALLTAMVMPGLAWLDNQYHLGRVENWHGLLKGFFLLAFFAPFFHLCIQNLLARKLNKDNAGELKANTFSFFEAIITLSIFGMLGWGGTSLLPNNKEAETAKQISGHIEAVETMYRIQSPALIQARQWLASEQDTKQHWEEIQELAQASTSLPDRMLMRFMKEKGVEGPEMDYFRENRLVRASDMRSLLEKMEKRHD